MTTLTGAVIGYGRAGNIHVGNLVNIPGVRLKYIVDPVQGVKAGFPKGMEGCWAGSLDVVVNDAEVSFVVVCSPTDTHYEVISRCLQAGKHVFAEKPLCNETSQIALVYDEAERSNKLLFTAFNRRYDPKLMEAKAKFQSGECGEVLNGLMVSRDHPYPGKAYLEISGNLFKDCVVHDLDCMIWMLGENPCSVTATARSPGTERSAGMIENSQVFLKFPSGKLITLISSRVSLSYDQRVELYCAEGDIKVANPVSDVPLTFAQRYKESYINEMNAFLTQVRENCTVPNLSLEHSMFLDKLVKACHESVDSGKEVLV
eukprot:TRINITY_DN13677_c0_g1_i5.p1 TRINITY_DN13677_c0_g1~~TRINITY_DN13677_c0_g1_i5.p1  ORF type:complete len:316 (+),score=54.58 TRINITY_DN13677_c0_g1_i5:126-1073(+)